MNKVSVEEFWLELPEKTRKQIWKHQEKWADAFNKTGEEYFMLAMQPFGFGGTIKVSIIPSKVGKKIQKQLEKLSR